MLFDKIFIIELAVTGAVILTGVLLFCLLPRMRAYAGIMLIVAFIYITRAWRVLPSHKRWLEKEVFLKVNSMRAKARAQAVSSSNAPNELANANASAVANAIANAVANAVANVPSPQPEAGNYIPSGGILVDPRRMHLGRFPSPAPSRCRSPMPSMDASSFPSATRRVMPRSPSRPLAGVEPQQMTPRSTHFDALPVYFSQFPSQEAHFDAGPTYLPQSSPQMSRRADLNARSACFQKFQSQMAPPDSDFDENPAYFQQARPQMPPPDADFDASPGYFQQFQPQMAPPDTDFDEGPAHFSQFPPQNVDFNSRPKRMSRFSTSPSKRRPQSCAAQRIPTAPNCAADQSIPNKTSAAQTTEPF